MKTTNILFLLIIILNTVILANATVSTYPATQITACGATLHGNTTIPSTVWFEYSGISNNYMYKTPSQSFTSGTSVNYSAIICGLPIIANQQYYFRAVDSSGNVGLEETFTASSVAQENYSFDSNFDELLNAKLNITALMIVIPKPYTDLLGSIFWGVLFGMIFVIMWIRQEDVTIPALIGLLIGASLWSLLPPVWTSMAYTLTIVSFAGLMYSLIKKP